MRKFGSSIILALALTACASFAAAAPPTAAVSWTAPTTNADGSALTGTLTYNLYQGLAGALVKVQSAITGLNTTVTTGLTAASTQCFAVTAVEAGVESAQSVAACGLIPQLVPGVPSQITVVIH